MLHRFYALDNDVDVQRAADFDNGGDQPALRQRRDNRLDDLPIDLQSSWFKSKQADDAGMFGAEVVDLDFNAERFDCRNYLGEGGLKIIEGDRLEQLETQAALRYRKFGQLG